MNGITKFTGLPFVQWVRESVIIPHKATPAETQPTQSTNLMTCLRQETQDLHTRIESRLDFSVCFASHAKYRRLLERYYGFYAPFEVRLFAPERAADWAALEIDSDARRKTRWLDDDLTALDAERITVPLCPQNALPHPGCPGELIGCAYVLEGATLGGQIIGRHIEKSLGLTVGAPGARFFYGYGAETGTLWKRFRRAAEAFAERENTLFSDDAGNVCQKAVAFARQTFVALENHVFSTPFD